MGGARIFAVCGRAKSIGPEGKWQQGIPGVSGTCRGPVGQLGRAGPRTGSVQLPLCPQPR